MLVRGFHLRRPLTWDQPSKDECIARLSRCLGEIVVAGVDTNIPLFQELLANPDIVDGVYNIHWLENWMKAQAV